MAEDRERKHFLKLSQVHFSTFVQKAKRRKRVYRTWLPLSATRVFWVFHIEVINCPYYITCGKVVETCETGEREREKREKV